MITCKIKLLIFILGTLGAVLTWPAYSQLRASGHVTDSLTNYPMPGVNVILVGTATGTTTDTEGNFQLDVPFNSRIRLSFIGYKTVDFMVKDESIMNIKMQEDIFRPFISFNNNYKLEDLMDNISMATVEVEVKFKDNTSYEGIGIRVKQSEDSELVLVPVQLVNSEFRSEISEIIVGRNKHVAAVEPLPKEILSANKEFALLKSENLYSSKEKFDVLFSKKTSRRYFIYSESEDSLIRLKVTRLNRRNDEIYLRNHLSDIPLGAPIINKYGIAGFVVDNIGSEVIARSLASSMTLVYSHAGDTMKFNRTRYHNGIRPKTNPYRFSIGGLNTGFRAGLAYYQGADLKRSQTQVSPVVGIFVATSISSRFSLGYDLSVGTMQSHTFLNSPLPYRRTKTEFFRHSMFLDPLLFDFPNFNRGRSTLSLGLHIGISLMTIDTKIVNEAGTEIEIEEIVDATVDKTVFAYSFGGKINYSHGDRHGGGIRYSRTQIHSPYFAVDPNTLPNPSNKHDSLVILDIFYRYILK